MSLPGLNSFSELLGPDSEHWETALEIDRLFGLGLPFPAQKNLLNLLLELVPKLPEFVQRKDAWLDTLLAVDKKQNWREANLGSQRNPVRGRFGRHPLAAFLLQHPRSNEDNFVDKTKSLKLLFLYVLIQREDLSDHGLSYHADNLRLAVYRANEDVKKLPVYQDDFQSYLFETSEIIKHELKVNKDDEGLFYSLRLLLEMKIMRRASSSSETSQKEKQPPERRDTFFAEGQPNNSRLRKFPISSSETSLGEAPDLIDIGEAELFPNPPQILKSDIKELAIFDEFTAESQSGDSKYWLRKHSRLVPYDTSVFTINEKQQIARYIKEGLQSKDFETQVRSGLIGLMYVTGMQFPDLFKSTVGPNQTFTAAGTYNRPVKQPKDAFEPNSEEINHLCNVAKNITLKLPEPIAEWMRNVCVKGGPTFGECLGLDFDKADDLVKDAAEELREGGIFWRIRLERLTAALPWETTLQFRNPSMTYFLSSRESQAPSVLNYYVALPAHELADGYSIVASKMLNPRYEYAEPSNIEESTRLSGHYPNRSAISDLIQITAKKIKRAMESDSVAVRHNAFTDYCLALLLCCTAHRPVKDPISSQKLFDLETGLMLISDKVVFEEQAWRLVALPPIARKQLQYYLDYLPRLAAWVEFTAKNKSTELSRSIRSLIAGGHDMPLFFYLNEDDGEKWLSVVPSLMTQRMKEQWGLPLNFLRHMAATELLKASGKAELATIQLGHLETTNHPFGITATESALDVLSSISTFLNQCMQQLGWEPIRSSVRLPQGAASNEVDNIKRKKHSKYGEWERRQKRKQKRQRLSSYVREAFNTVLQDEEGIHSLEQVEAIENHILANAPTSLVDGCLRLLYRRLSLSADNPLSVKNKRVFIPKKEPSPFSEDTLSRYKQAKEVRAQFHDYLDECYKDQTELDPARRIAEIVLSSALHGGIADAAKLERVIESLGTTLYGYKASVFLDISLSNREESPVFRWFSDEITQLLLKGCFDSNLAGAIEKREVLSSLVSILKTFGIKSTNATAIDALAQLAESLVLIEMPGHLAKVLTGGSNSVSVPLKQWVRMHSGQALDECPTEKKEIKTTATPILISSTMASAPSRKQVKKFILLLRRLFTEAKQQPAKGSMKRSTKMKKTLAELLRSEFESPKSEWSVQLLTIGAWAIYLCEHGTRMKKNLAFSTIDKYVFLVARTLLQVEVSNDFLEFGDDEYESLYLDILEAFDDERRPDIAGRLYEYHSFLVEAYAVPNITWSSIFGVASTGKTETFSNANFIVEEEYLALIKAMNEHLLLIKNPRKRAQYISLVMLGYRYNLRFGEAIRLRYCDVQFFEENMCINVNNSIYGETKSSAGVRNVPLIESVTDIEQDAFRQLIEAAEVYLVEDKQVALMNDGTDPRALINRSVASEEINQFLKAVTGDNSLRFHHLRHSWATRMYSQMYDLKLPDTYQAIASPSLDYNRWQDFVGSHPTQYPLTSISTAIGHQNEETTLQYYVHSLDAGLKNFYRLDRSVLSSRGLGYAAQLTSATARSYSHRGSILNVPENIPVPSMKLKSRPNPQEIKLEDNLKKTVTLVLIERLLNHYRLTQRSIEQVASNLFIDPETAQQILDAGREIERRSGFEYYWLQSLDDERLFLSEESKIKLLKKQKQTKTFIAQDQNILRVLKEKQRVIDSLSDGDKKKLKAALATWSHTLKGDHNIVSDYDELENLRFLQTTLFIDAHPEKVDETNSSLEKTGVRRSSAKLFTLQPDKDIRTYQMLKRIVMLIAIYESVDMSADHLT